MHISNLLVDLFVCVCIDVCGHVCGYIWKPEAGVKSLGFRVTAICGCSAGYVGCCDLNPGDHGCVANILNH